MITPLVVIGAQWGDEGKGKLVDAISADFDVVGRFNGGNNAGHTVIYKGEVCKLHILPSGMFQRKKLLIAQGAVFDPEVLIAELSFAKSHHIPLDLLIDYRVNLVMPYHKQFDGAHEAWKGKHATGSVKVGIGYCYEDRNNRSGIRIEDLLYPKILKEKLERIVPLKMAILQKVYGITPDFTVSSLYKRLMYLAKIIKPFAGDVSAYVAKNIGVKRMLFEGAMGVMLDGSFGTYPYTVANQTITSALFPSLGIPPQKVDVLATVKAYTTRVGGGPFPTEQTGKWGKFLQTVGHEVAATSGRIRRCGWLDLPVVRYAHRLNRFTSIALMKLDVLSGLKEIPVCVGYKIGKKIINEYPSISHDYYHCQPMYKTLKGWQSPIGDITSYAQLPSQAKAYIKFIEKDLNVPISYISVGAGREALIQK